MSITQRRGLSQHSSKQLRNRLPYTCSDSKPSFSFILNHDADIQFAIVRWFFFAAVVSSYLLVIEL